MVFETREALGKQIQHALDRLRGLAGGRYACILDRKDVLWESEDEGAGGWALRRMLVENTEPLFALPAVMAGDTPAPEKDLFDGWDDDDFLLAFLNGHVAVVVACPDAPPLEEEARPLLQALADLLLRYERSWRLDMRCLWPLVGARGAVRWDRLAVGGRESPHRVLSKFSRGA